MSLEDALFKSASQTDSHIKTLKTIAKLSGNLAAGKYELWMIRETTKLRVYICSNFIISKTYERMFGTENTLTKDRLRRYAFVQRCLSALYQE